jgi:phenylpropionate dioxygenase-like ring-hydroxylating dioxygenase large terminal subunit
MTGVSHESPRPETKVPERDTKLQELIRSDAVHVSIYRDEDIFLEEMRRIWRGTWVYVGHDSEVAVPGDYTRKQLGLDPVIFGRDKHGEIQVFLNQCLHRGNLVCEADAGNSAAFRCSYHGWTYNNDGRLLGVPYRDGYSDEMLQGLRGLRKPARVDSYRGFVFASFNPDVPDLRDHLGHACAVIDRFVDLAPNGELELRAGCHKLAMDGNWKLWAENCTDNYHQNFVHEVAFFGNETQRKTATTVSSRDSGALVRDLGNGHGELDFRPMQRSLGLIHRTALSSLTTAEDEQQLRDDLVQRLGQERVDELTTDGPPYLYVFPNLFLLQQDVRTVVPVSATESEVMQYPALLGGAPRSVNLARLERHAAAYGPAGSVIPDDVEIWERVQHAVRGLGDDWVFLARGQERQANDEDGLTVGHVTDEVGIRAFWQEYRRLMTADEAAQPAAGSGRG